MGLFINQTQIQQCNGLFTPRAFPNQPYFLTWLVSFLQPWSYLYAQTCSDILQLYFATTCIWDRVCPVSTKTWQATICRQANLSSCSFFSKRMWSLKTSPKRLIQRIKKMGHCESLTYWISTFSADCANLLLIQRHLFRWTFTPCPALLLHTRNPSQYHPDHWEHSSCVSSGIRIRIKMATPSASSR